MTTVKLLKATHKRRTLYKSNMPISHKHKAIFIHIPKTAGTSISEVLNMRGAWPKWDPDKLFGPRKFNGKFYHVQHLTGEELLKFNCITPAVLQDYLSFCIVRNPSERAVSDFLWMMQRCHYTGKRFRKYGPAFYALHRLAKKRRLFPSPQTQKEFGRFLRHAKGVVHESRREGMCCHYWPQTTYCLDKEGREMVDVIGRFERLSKDFGIIASKLDISPLPVLPAMQVSQQRYDYREYYDRESKDLVEEIYARDIAYLGYTFDGTENNEAPAICGANN